VACGGQLAQREKEVLELARKLASAESELDAARVVRPSTESPSAALTGDESWSVGDVGYMHNSKSEDGLTRLRLEPTDDSSFHEKGHVLNDAAVEVCAAFERALMKPYVAPSTWIRGRSRRIASYGSAFSQVCDVVEDFVEVRQRGESADEAISGWVRTW
jgi:hypothetical protein